MSDWRDKAACRGIAHNPNFNPDEDPFYDPPEREDGGDKWAYARALCATCPVQMDCLNDTLRTEGKGGVERFGFRGGATPHMRRRISLGLPATAKRTPRPKTPTDKKSNQASTAAALRKREEWVETIIDLLDMGVPGNTIPDRLSRRADGIHKRLARAGRLDVWERLDIPQTLAPRKAS